MSNKLIPPFTEETARAKVKAAQDAWNSRDPVYRFRFPGQVGGLIMPPSG